MNQAAVEMMPTFHPDPKAAARDERGFSLLEMLVVLAIMGVVLSIVSIRLVSSLEATRFSKTADAAIAEIRLIRLNAILDNQAVRIVGSDSSPTPQSKSIKRVLKLNVPADWQVVGDNILISRTGFCSGGKITLIGKSNRQVTYSLSAPNCSPRKNVLPSSRT